MEMTYNHTDCLELHPEFGQCVRGMGHSKETNDPSTRQHEAGNGVKWPSLHALDPLEGFNGRMPYRI